MAESRRGKLTPRTIKVKLRDSVSVSSGSGRGGSSGGSRSGGGSKGTKSGITATVVKPAPQPKVGSSAQRKKVIRQQQTRGGGLQQRRESRVDTDEFKRDTKERFEGAAEEGKNFLFGGIKSELSRGSGVTGVGGTGVVTDPKTGELITEAEKQITPDTVSEKIFSGRVGEIDLREPRTQGQAAGLAALVAAPAGGKGIGKVKGGIEKQVQKSKVSQLEKNLGLKGQSEKLGKDTFITGGGTESRPEALYVTRFGKGKTKVMELTPTGDRPQTLSPKETTIYGKLDPTSQKRMGARQEGNFRFTSSLKTGLERRTLQKGIFQGEVKEFAKGRETELSNILKKKPERIYSDIKKPPSVYSQTKAEKLSPTYDSKRNVGTGPRTPFGSSSGSGGGKTATFTKQQEKLIRTKETPPKRTGGQKGLTTSIFPSASARQEQVQEQSLRAPPKSQPPSRMTKAGLVPSVTPVIDVQPKSKLGSLVPSKLKFREEIKLDLGRGSITRPDTGLKIRDDVTFRQGQKSKPKTQLGDPETPPTIRVVPEPEVPPDEPIRPPVPIGPPFPRVGGGGSDPDFISGRRRSPFVGNTKETEIIGIFNKPEINPGRTRTFTEKKPKKKTTKIFGKGSGVSISTKSSKVRIF